MPTTGAIQSWSTILFLQEHMLSYDTTKYYAINQIEFWIDWQPYR